MEIYVILHEMYYFYSFFPASYAKYSRSGYFFSYFFFLESVLVYALVFLMYTTQSELREHSLDYSDFSVSIIRYFGKHFHPLLSSTEKYISFLFSSTE